MNIQLSDHFDLKKLLRFTLPSIVMMIFTSVYGVVDGFFVSNFVGKTPFAAVNFIMPFLMILGAVGFMFGTGGSALIAITVGAGDRKKANRLFSLFVYVSGLCGIAIAVFGILFIRPIASLLGAEGAMLDQCVSYGRVILVTLPAYMLQFEFQSFFATAEKPQLGLAVTIAAGVTNMVLDALFVAVFKWGLLGAAAATALSQAVGGLLPLIYFARPNTSILRLTRTRFDGKALLKACTNGSSELMTNISMSLVTVLYNYQLMALAGENGVAAYGVIMYMNFVFCAMFIGYAIGCAPIVSYHYGAGGRDELGNLFRKSLVIMAATGCAMTLLGQVMAAPLTRIFVGYDRELYELTCQGMRIYALSFILSGFNIFGSSFFTALGNGGVSAAISFLRTLVFQIVSVLVLPMYLGVSGIWLSIVAAEGLALAVTACFLASNRKRYGYA